MSAQIDRFLNTPCLNCGNKITGRFCAACGQPTTDTDQSLKGLLGDFFNQGLSLDSTIWQTLRNLVLKPGHLTAEYLNGRRATYFSPIRLYLLMSLLYFTFNTMPGNLVVNSEDESSATTDSTVVLTGADALEELLSDEGSFSVEVDSTSSFLAKLLPDEEVLERIQKNPNKFVGNLVENIPHAMFVMVPIFGLLLWLFYFRRHRQNPLCCCYHKTSQKIECM